MANKLKERWETEDARQKTIFRRDSFDKLRTGNTDFVFATEGTERFTIDYLLLAQDARKEARIFGLINSAGGIIFLTSLPS